jgi:hypothetical protein
MSTIGTQEAKRRQKALPQPLGKPVRLGCFASLAVCLAFCSAIFAGTRWIGALLFAGVAAFMIAGLAAWYLYGLILLAIVWRRWTPRGVRCLLVCSDSPLWRDHIQTHWLSRIGDAAIVLNWSERASWHSDLRVRVFRRFCGERRNFNPAVVVFRGLREPYVFRFFYAFQEVKANRRQYLETLEAQMFEALGLDQAA